jgi:uncharacterized protein (TIGR03083 family)
MTKAEFLDRLRSGRAEWDALIAQIDKARMTEPGVVGDWSVKDIIAHVTWSEREMVGMLQARALVGSDLWNQPQDDRNAAVFRQNRDRPLPDVLAEARAVGQQLTELVEGLSDDELNDASHFADMPLDWLPWRIIAGNTYGHYPEHAEAIRAWQDTLSAISGPTVGG